MKMHIWIMLAMFYLLSCTAEEEGSNDFDYFIFGDFYGFCMGDCAHFFKIEDGKIYEDDIENGYLDAFSFQSQSLGREEYQLGIALAENFPEALWEDATEVFGMPDAYDQGGIILEMSRAGEVRSWTLDNDVRNLPVYLQAYAGDVREVLQEIKQ